MKKALSTAFVLAIISSASAQAGSLKSPYVDKGEAEIEYGLNRVNDSSNAKNNEQSHQIEFAYGVTESWGIEVATTFDKEPDSETKFDSIEFENIFQLTEKNEYLLDVGALLAYEHTPQTSSPDKVEAKLILTKDLNTTFHIINLTLEDEIGSGGQETPEASLRWGSRYKLSEEFEPGFEIYSDFGHLNNQSGFDDQEHYIGPAAYGELEVYSGEKDIELEYRVAYMFGISEAAHDGELVLEIGHEFEF